MKRLLFPILAAGFLPILAAVEMPAIFSDNMVLQRDREIPLWGTGRSGEEITVEFGSQSASTRVNEEGRWRLAFPAQPADSRNRTLTVRGDNVLTFSNVLTGDVWICAGQSNMQFNLSKITGGEKLVAESENPRIRFYYVPRNWNRVPQKENAGKWSHCNPHSAAKAPAVGYLAALAISERLDIPVGLIGVFWGGCRIEALTAREAYRETNPSPPVAAELDAQFADLDSRPDEKLRKDKQRLPSGLFNAMVHPLTPYGVRGVFYYQGEDNHKDGAAYGEKLRAWAYSWRKYFRNETLALYLIQLPPHRYNTKHFELPELRAAQQRFAEADRNAGFVVTTDCGDPADIHPVDKAPLAGRLAALVLYREYGVGDDTALSPTFRSCTVGDGRVTVEFHHPNGLKTIDGKTVSHLELAGKDGRYHPATGVVKDDRLIVSSKAIPEPERIRFGWDELANPNLFNRAGVPVAPFEDRIEN